MFVLWIAIVGLASLASCSQITLPVAGRGRGPSSDRRHSAAQHRGHQSRPVRRDRRRIHPARQSRRLDGRCLDEVDRRLRRGGRSPFSRPITLARAIAFRSSTALGRTTTAAGPAAKSARAAKSTSRSAKTAAPTATAWLRLILRIRRGDENLVAHTIGCDQATPGRVIFQAMFLSALHSSGSLESVGGPIRIRPAKLRPIAVSRQGNERNRRDQ